MSDTPLSGINLDDLSDEVRPQDDLFRHVNERWIDSTPIPPDKASYGTFMRLFEDSEQAVRGIVEEARSAPEGSEPRKFGDLYESFMNEARGEELGAAPLQSDLARVDAVTSISELIGAVGELQRGGLSGFVDVFVDNDPGNPDRYLVFVEQGGISLPDESYFREEHFASVREAFVVHIRKMLELAGIDDAAARAARVFELETEIAKRHWDNVASRDSEKTYNLLSFEGASELFAVPAPAVSLEQWASAFGAPEGALNEVVVRQPSFLHELAELFGEDRLESWKDWLRWQVVHGYSPYLSKAFVDEQFDFYGRTLTGAPELRERWKRALSLVEGSLGEAVGRIYIERHFPPSAKQSMDVLVANLVEAYRASIATLEWMSPVTRERA
ncbi:MAG TPA: M13 family metallopeptidase N-terminal domain-containing protein, partial [Acidimicrobiales bacterium]|nr:M13 family metallopeptidase N-terminal domain-containing protein [Acidimicrobiales bacterium]